MDITSYILGMKAGGGSSGIPTNVKQALLTLLEAAAYSTTELEDEIAIIEAWVNGGGGGGGDPTLTSISAVYTQSGTVYDTDSLDSLKADLVVTATYDDSSTETVTTYTLSGTLAVGTSTITVSYGGKTATFSVTVTEQRIPSGYTEYDYLKMNKSYVSVASRGILTDAQLSTDDTVELKIYIPSDSTSSSAAAQIGTRNGQSGTKEFALFIKPSTGSLGYWINSSDTVATILAIEKGQVNTIKVLPVGKSSSYPNNNVINVNGTDYNTTVAHTGVTFDSWFGIFNYATSATTINTGSKTYIGEQIGEIIVKDSSDNLKYDFIPASNGSVSGYYESVNRQFYYEADYASIYVGGYWEESEE